MGAVAEFAVTGARADAVVPGAGAGAGQEAQRDEAQPLPMAATISNAAVASVAERELDGGGASEFIGGGEMARIRNNPYPCIDKQRRYRQERQTARFNRP